MDLFEQMAALRREGRAFALATVVARRPPVSAHLGDRALVFPDGRMEGFVGGACSHEIVRRQALEALTTRQARLVSIRPDAGRRDESDREHVVVPMTCVSEGAIDVYVEPFVQARRLIVAGATPVAAALARLARSMDYEVVRVVDARERGEVEPDAASLGVTVATLETLAAILDEGVARGLEQAAVVVSQGHYDEEALETVLKSGVAYVGLVASRKRGATARALLEERHVPDVERMRNPAGLALGARTPPEVALSILAEIVQARPSGAAIDEERPGPGRPEGRPLPEPQLPQPAAAAQAVDPVCGMSVDVAGARHTADAGGVTYYFCCANCRARFLKDPRAFGAAP